MKKRIAKLSTDSLFQMGDALRVQQYQIDSAELEKSEIDQGLDALGRINAENRQAADEASDLVDALFAEMGNGSSGELCDCLRGIVAESDSGQPSQQPAALIHRTKTVRTCNDWERYTEECSCYSQTHEIDLALDPFCLLLSQNQSQALNREVHQQFAQKTSISNQTDLSFLAIATALQTAKALLFPMIAEKLYYGESFDPDSRFQHNDKYIKAEEKDERTAFRNQKIQQGNESGKWLEFLYQSVPFDAIKGSKDVLGTGLCGTDHRLHTLGHDPILGWIFGTANILTDTITLDTFQTFRVIRQPQLKMTPVPVSLTELFSESYRISREGALNLPAAVVAEKIHLKSDAFTKAGLPVPLLQTFSPDLAGKLYHEQYDALCFGRDVRIVGSSAVISMLINMVIGLAHGLYYDPETDGSRDFFEARTRKILLISNTIASSSNILYSIFTKNPKALDIGGLLVTISRLFSNTGFILNLKREFIENRIYEKIEQELADIDRNWNRIAEVEYNKLSL